MKPRLTNHRTLAAIDKTSKLFEVPARELVGRCRQPAIVRARFALYAALKQTCETSYPHLAVIFKRHHTTIIHGYDQALAMASADPEYADAIRQIAGVLQ